MKLLFLNHNTAWTGTFFRAYHLGRQLAAGGHDVTLLTTLREGRRRSSVWQRDGVRVIEAPDLMNGSARQGFDPWNTFARLRLLRGERPDVVHAFDSRPVVILPALRVARESGARLVLDWADWWGRGGTIEERSGWAVRTFFGPVETWFEEAFRTRADWTTVISQALAERAIRLGVPRERVLRFSHGCDVAGFRPHPRGAARRELGLDAETPLAAHLGVLLPSDAALLFETVRLLRERMPATRLVLLGGTRVDVPADLVETGAVLRTGFIPYEALQLWLSAVDVGVLALRDTLANRARWPSKVNDYLAAGLPIVTSRVGDVAAVVAANGAGWTCAATAGDLAGALEVALTEPVERQRAGVRARALAEGALSWRSIADRVAAVYAALMDGPASSLAAQGRTA
jgi:glycosyltransferase involved in cell wall biosynthesis